MRGSVIVCGALALLSFMPSPGLATSPVPFPFDPPPLDAELPKPPLFKADGADGGRTEFTVRVARDPEGWRSLWMEVGKAVPDDFTFNPERSMAVAVHFGHGPGRVSRIQLLNAGERRGQLVVTYGVAQLAPGTAQTKPVPSPWAIAVFARRGLSVVVRGQNIWHPVWFENDIILDLAK